jgi:tetratricopeptide (TPR) repeat protein
MSLERIEQLLDFLKEDPTDPFCHYALALELIRIGRTEEAEKNLEQLLATDPGYLAAYYQLGKIYESRGKTDAAIATYQKGITVAGKNSDHHTLAELASARDSLLEP